MKGHSARLDTDTVFEFGPNTFRRRTHSSGGFLQRRPLRCVVDMTEQIEVGEPEGPRLGLCVVGWISSQHVPGRYTTFGS